MGNWKVSVNGLNQGRLPRGGGLEEEYDSDGQKKKQQRNSLSLSYTFLRKM